MALPNFPNFLSRAKAIGTTTIFMTGIGRARTNMMSGNYESALYTIDGLIDYLARTSAYKAYVDGVQHARTATAASMMEDLRKLYNELDAYAKNEAEPITDDELFGNNENA